MAWYVEFEVENEEAEKRFWKCLEDLGCSAEKFQESGNWADLFDVEQAAFDLAKEMGYNVETM